MIAATIAGGFAASAGARRQLVNMSYHGGAIMPTSNIQTIFWGPSWADSSFVTDKITGLDSFYTGFSGSNYAKASDEYTGYNGQVGAATSYQGHIVDTSTASGGGSPAVILAEIQKQVTAGNIVPDPSGNGFYAVYVDLPRGIANYCSYHASGSVGGHTVQFAFFWNLNGDAGCDPQDSTTSHSQGLAALANRSAVELSQARTDTGDPGGFSFGWHDSSGRESGDKCAWTFNVPSVSFPNGTSWKLQGLWSNAAFTARTGYPNSSKQHGCVDGH